MGSAIGVIYSKHQTRKIFVKLQKIHKQIDELEVEWGQLQLEQSAWSSHGRIEKIARKKLHMTLPKANEILYIKQ
ncbi:Cell division protein FtsL [hydrothermal vent metagenome]|uniref:Cell division protein FtsL n=1 Tax=hydrothermal vent metagenome TaxID=652676 RepID=A0A3B0Y266_9ZZZZ